MVKLLSEKSGKKMEIHKKIILIMLTMIIRESFSRPVEDKLMAALRSLSEEELQILEGLGTSSDEEMMGDQPQVSNDTFVYDRTLSWDILGGRDREERIKSIKRRVLEFVGRDGKSNTTLPQPKKQQSQIFQEILRTTEYNLHMDVNALKRRSILASCEVPRNTDEESWDVSQAMNLYFDLTYITPAQGVKLDVHSAVLRLYQLSTSPAEEKVNPILVKKNGDDQRIRVSAYYYTRSLKKQKVKKRLSDSQMLSFSGKDWTELNVKTAVNTWKDSGRNFGIAVEVEDEDRNILQASKYFVPINCSKEALSALPIPRFLVDVVSNKTYNFEKVGIPLFPTLELTTYEPEVVQYPVNGHRIRHQHHRQLHSPPVNDSIEQIPWDDPTIPSNR